MYSPGHTQVAELHLESRTSKPQPQSLILFIASWQPHSEVEGQDACVQCQNQSWCPPHPILWTRMGCSEHMPFVKEKGTDSLPTLLNAPGFLS